MPDIKYTWKGKLPYHASHKIAGKWTDLCLGDGDIVMLPDTAEDEPTIKNLVKSGFLVSENAPAVKKNKAAKKQVETQPQTEPTKQETTTDNNSNA